MAIDASFEGQMEKTTEAVVTGVKSRIFFIDHLRAALVILVVLHHVALVYAFLLC